MALLQVRDFPDDMYKQIGRVAKKQNRTIAQQTIVLLEKGLRQQESNKERVKITLERIKNRDVPDRAKEIDAVKLIREDRER